MRDNISKIYQSIGFSKWLGNGNGNGNGNTHTHTQCVHKSNISNIETTTTDPMYISWLEEHPCALCVFKMIINDAKGKQIVVFLDYDGTLSPIVDDPNRAFMSDEMRAAVSDVAKHFSTAIISGRLREKVYEFVKLEEVYYAGSHGMDIVGPPLQSNGYDSNNNGNEGSLFQPAKEFLPALQKIMEELKTRTSGIIGVYIEDNRYSLSVHYRHVRTIEYDELEKIVVSIAEEFETFKVTKGIKVLEIRPDIDWNKGNALLYLLQTLGFTNYDNVLPIYIGDDLTDEDAFKALKKMGHGCPIIVSSVAKETTLASYSLRDPSQVKLFLDQLAKWGEETKLIKD